MSPADVPLPRATPRTAHQTQGRAGPHTHTENFIHKKRAAVDETSPVQGDPLCGTRESLQGQRRACAALSPGEAATLRSHRFLSFSRHIQS
ncbi:hypothetical protein RRG08_023328 [Elysia crispata]|uniref:Uncharacterized protein n=1 Tax=Elysia crispata TaxID=231223 RepID=A0AAE1EE89_9GAST|nr:hypothetical protein RRG08_023328 [Elysia crispata]